MGKLLCSTLYIFVSLSLPQSEEVFYILISDYQDNGLQKPCTQAEVGTDLELYEVC